jgi:hypothetical protein
VEPGSRLGGTFPLPAACSPAAYNSRMQGASNLTLQVMKRVGAVPKGWIPWDGVLTRALNQSLLEFSQIIPCIPCVLLFFRTHAHLHARAHAHDQPCGQAAHGGGAVAASHAL